MLTILFAKDFPEALQGYSLPRARSRRKKTPFRLSCMLFLLEWGDPWPRANAQASKERRQIIPESLAKGQSSQVRGSSVCCFWGDRKHLDKLLQAYACEKAKIEARRRGHSVTEQTLADGSIKLTIGVQGGAA